MYAIIEEGGKQYKVTSGDTILIDRHVKEDEKSIKFDRVLLVGGEGEPKIGLPTVSKATVSADVIGEEKGVKIDIQKYKRRKGYHKKIGHRQRYVRVKITGINV
jgi:large subunit ribosomal protein L21